VDEGAQVRLDDDLVMHFTKELGMAWKNGSGRRSS
jgi:hypothetical protein